MNLTPPTPTSPEILAEIRRLMAGPLIRATKKNIFRLLKYGQMKVN